MKSVLRITFAVFFSGLLLSSCKKKNEEGKMIPKNALFVLHLNSKSLLEKLPWDEIKKTSWFQKAAADSSKNAWITRLLDNPENSGIDTDGSLFFFAVKDPGTNGQLVLEGSIKNESDFLQMNKHIDSSATLQTSGGLNVLTLKDAMAVAWDNKHFAYAFDAGSARSKFNEMNPMGHQGNMAPLTGKNEALSAFCQKLFSLKSDSSLAANDKFAALLRDNGDIHTWINAEEIARSSSAMGMIGMLKLDVFLKNNISTYSVNFDNGKIDIHQKGYAGKEFSDFMEKYSGKSIDEDMIRNIPSQNVLGVFAMNFKPEGIKELIKLSGMDGFLNVYTAQAGFDLDDFVKANKGDIMLALTDLSLGSASGKAGEASTPKKPEMNVVFSVAIGDKPSFQKLEAAGKKITAEMSGGNDTSISYGQNDKVFVISNHRQFLTDYLAGKANSKFDFLSKLGGHPIGLYIDLHQILSAIASGKEMNEDNKEIMDESLKLWNNIFITGGDYKDGGLTGTTEINFMDQQTNSLKQLNHYLDVIAKKVIAKRMSGQPDKTNLDSLMQPPPIDTVGHK